jgi:two-component system, NtrC family, sensor histidine kinase GlrK
MRFYHPKSFLTLLMLGFAVVLLPMLAALINAELALGRLSRGGAGAVYRSVGIAQGSRVLVDKIITLERRARQYDVLGDRQLLDEAANTHAEIEQALVQLFALPLNETQKQRITLLYEREKAVFSVLRSAPHGSPEQKEALQEFAGLNALANEIYAESNELIFREADSLRQTTAEARRTLLLHAAALIPFTLLVVAGSIRLLSKPVRQIDKAIHRLGEGDFETQVTVSGPDDLVFLGERLDWLRKQLAEVEKTKAMFVAQVSHELKTPLASIREGAELLAEGVVGRLNAQQQEISAILCKSSIHLQKLIENLLGFSKAQASISPLHLADVRMAELVTSVLADHKAIILKKKLRMEVKLESVTVRGDRARLRTVVDNLLSNAIKFTPPTGRIELTLSERTGEMVFEVADTGPGVPLADQGKIFEPFFQGSISAPGPIMGTGLGLSICREFVNAHGGTLHLVGSTTKGARFRFSLPLPAKRDTP